MWFRKAAPEIELLAPGLTLSLEMIAKARSEFEAFAKAAHNDLAVLSARVEKLEFLLHQRDNMGQGPAAVTRLPFREFKRLKESGLNPKGA
jgi:hypothetical protein